MNLSDCSEIIKVIKQAGIEAVETKKPSAILFGTVQSIEPLSIFIDQKTILEADELILVRNVTDFQTEISFDDSSIKNEIQIGNRPLAPDGVLTVNPDTGAEESSPAILKGKLSFQEKIRHKITVYNSLKIGEKVIVQRMQGGQRFVILDRVVAV